MDRPPAHAPRHPAGSVAAAVLALGVALAGCSSPPAPTGPDQDVEVGDDTAEAFPSLGTAADTLDETVVRVAAASGTHEVRAKVAATDVDRQRGLMRVAELPEDTGMLFLFDEDRTGGFWMRDALVPLDIAYLDADGTIVAILAMDPCEAADAGDCPVYRPPAPYRAALEVPQGWFATAGVVEGDTVSWDDPVPSTVGE